MTVRQKLLYWWNKNRYDIAINLIITFISILIALGYYIGTQTC